MKGRQYSSAVRLNFRWTDSLVKRLFKSGVRWINRLGANFLETLHFAIQWRYLVEGLLILIIVFMPALSAKTAGTSWGILIPLVLILGMVNPPEPELDLRQPHPVGFVFLWTVLALSALLSPASGGKLAFLFRFGSWFTLAWLVSKVFKGKTVERILKYLTFSSLIWLIIGFWQLFSGMHTPKGWLGTGQVDIIPVRIYSVFGNPNIFALYLLIVLVFSHYFLVRGATKTGRIILAGIITIVLISLYFTYSRTAWLLTGIFMAFQLQKRWRYGLLCAGFGLMILFFIPGFQSRITSLITLKDDSLEYRIRIWQGVCRALGDNWLWGAGPGSFQQVYPEYQLRNTTSQHAHEIYLQFWLEYGLFGLLALVAVLKRILTPVSLCFPKEPSLITPLTIAIIIFLVYGLSETWYIQSFCGGFFWFLTGLFLAVKKYSAPPPNEKWREST